MAYEKQGFYSGEKLKASQLDAMEDGIINAEKLAMEAASQGAQADYNENDSASASYIKNRPFYEGYAYDPITWDGVVGDKEIIDVSALFKDAFMVKVSDVILTYEDLIGTTITSGTDESVIISENNIVSKEESEATGVYGFGSYVGSVFDSEKVKTAYGLDVPTGTYSVYVPTEGFYVKSISKMTIKKIDEKFLPKLASGANMEKGTGVSATQQLPDGVADGFDFTGKNPNATALDPSLTGIIPYGATGDFANAFGGKSAAIGKRSTAEGTTTIAKGKYSHVEGDNSVTLGNDSHAEGYSTVSKGTASHAQNYGTQAIGHSSHAGGLNTIAEGDYSTTIGHTTHALGNSSFAGGYNSQADGDASLAYGSEAVTEKNYSIAIGNNVIAKYSNLIALGHFNDPMEGADEEENPPIFMIGNGNSNENRKNALVIFKQGETAICGDTYIDGKLTIVGAPTEPEHAVRYADIMHNLCDDRENATVRGRGSSANTYNSFAFGQGAIAGDPIVGMGHCIAMGNQTRAIGYSSAAIGYKTIASVTGQLATGSCNKRNDNTYFIVGNGTEESPSNAFEVYTNGDLGICKNGKIYSLHKMLASYFTDANLK